MKYIAGFITDTHLSKHNVELNLNIFKQSIDICKEKNIPLFHGGDFLEERKTQDFDAKEGFERVLDLFKENESILCGIVGNHEKKNYSSEKNWLSQFSHHPNFKLIQSFGFVDIWDFRVHLLPYFLESDNYKDYLKKCEGNIDKKKTNVLLTHISLTGAKNNDGTKVENTLTVKDFDSFDLILSGHYHQKQKLGKFIYFGSAYQANYGENEEKGITLLKEDGSIEFIQLNFKKYIKVKIDLDSIDNKELARLTKDNSDSEDNIRFEFIGSENKLKSLKKELFTANGIEVATKVKEIEDSLEFIEGDEVISFTTSNIMEEFTAFCEKEELKEEDGKSYLTKKLNING